MSATHRTIATPDPRYRSLVVSVGESSFASNGGVIPIQGTLYSSDLFKGLLGSDYHKEFDDFVYTQQLPDSKTGGELVFARHFSDEQKKTPFRVTSKFGNHRWPPILKQLQFIQARDFPITSQLSDGKTIYANRYLVREVYIPEVNEGSRFVTEEFISDTKFDIPQYPVPTPTSISYHYLNLRGGFPECLHKKIDLKALISTTASYNGSVTTSNYNELQGQVFPATNFTEWAPYVLSDDQDLVGGVWYRKRIRVYPPPMPKTRVNVS